MFNLKQNLTKFLRRFLQFLEEENPLCSLIEQSKSVIIFVLDTDGVFTLSVGGGLKILNLKKGERIGKKISDIYKDQPKIIKGFKDALQGQSNVNIVYVCHQKTEIYWQLAFSPIQEKEKITGVIGVAMDVTNQQKQINAKTNFIANMSHEIRSPMNAIIGFSYLLKDEFNNSSKKDKLQQIDMISSNAHHLMNMINDWIDISKIDAGITTSEFKAFDLNRLLGDIVASFGVINNGVTISFNTELLNQKFMIVSDKSKLRQVLDNLINNSLKFTEKGSIEINYQVLGKDKKIKFSIKDTGIGIPKQDIDNIFKRFQSISNKNSKFKGTGLGLAISKNFVELLGGKIWVEESTLNKGTTMCFTINYEKTIT